MYYAYFEVLLNMSIDAVVVILRACLDFPPPGGTRKHSSQCIILVQQYYYFCCCCVDQYSSVMLCR